VTWQHFRAILWLRWRLLLNQNKKSGIVSTVIVALVYGLVSLAGAVFFVLAFLAGQFVLSQAPPLTLMVLWDFLAAGFLITWVAGLLTDLQRMEGLALEKLLHLPVSLTGAFVMNYLTSLFGLRMMFFLPPLLGLSLGLIAGKGAAMIVLLPLLLAFLLMITAITYQFQGWLASLMVNKRRRRLVIVIVTLTFILLGQLPNLLNIFGHEAQSFRGPAQIDGKTAKHLPNSDSQQAPKVQVENQQIHIHGDFQPFSRDPDFVKQIGPTVEIINVVFPPGWLALGAFGLAEGNIWPALFGTLGMTLLGSISLWRSYKTTMRLYTGRFTSLKRPAIAIQPMANTGSAILASPSATTSSSTSILDDKPTLLEKEVPGVPEQASAIALASFRSFLRAPEALLNLLTPVIMTLLFGGAILRNRANIEHTFGPLVAFGAMAMVLLGNQAVMCNQFGFDRTGFRVYVLSPVRRRDILLGKNLAGAPLMLGLGTVMAIILQLLIPMRLDHLLAVLPQYISMYLVFCLLANCASILAPAAVAAGAFRRSNFRGLAILCHLAFIPLFPLVQAPMLLPYGIEKILEDLTGLRGIPICLLLSVLLLVGVVYLYRWLLDFEGHWLQSREKKILEIVAAKAE
jgi:hypothetical protein